MAPNLTYMIWNLMFQSHLKLETCKLFPQMSCCYWLLFGLLYMSGEGIKSGLNFACNIAR